MPLRKLSSPMTSAETPADRLQTAVDELAGNVRVLADIVGEIREDLSWLTRNRMPHQPLVVQVQRMPRVPAGETGSFEFSLLSLPVSDPTAETLSDDQMRESVVDDLVDRLAEPLGQLAQDQLNMLMNVLDRAHRDLLQAIRSPQSLESTGQQSPKPATPRTQNSGNARAPSSSQSSSPPAESPPPPGQLF